MDQGIAQVFRDSAPQLPIRFTLFRTLMNDEIPEVWGRGFHYAGIWIQKTTKKFHTHGAYLSALRDQQIAATEAQQKTRAR